MSLSKTLLRASFVMSVILNSAVHAHPGHSNFGSAEDGTNYTLMIWMGVILAFSVYGGWRLFRALFSKPKTTESTSTDDQN